MDGDKGRGPDDERDDVPEEDIVPKGSGKQFAEDVADVHEVPTKGSDSGKGFAEGQAHHDEAHGGRTRRDRDDPPPADSKRSDRDT